MAAVQKPPFSFELDSDNQWVIGAGNIKFCVKRGYKSVVQSHKLVCAKIQFYRKPF
jgi:hypothetical protein